MHLGFVPSNVQLISLRLLVAASLDYDRLS